MTEMTQLLAEYGSLLVIAAVFFVQYAFDYRNRLRRDEKYAESMILLSKAIDNMASLIDLLRQSQENSTATFRVHDDRAVKINENMIDVKSGVSEIKNGIVEIKQLLHTKRSK